ncbi:ABC transporter substrate-binding protein [Xanthobacter tagetidis]|uniref:ABC transporter substrate-binding protein n=1 Tax=Xanthobacter tagetidis TaxID=60216 RepID=A0A3L7AK19_9HYPH|nr:ABC transporter substrate-binding protein [Xanthobacter tagetidis]MBB6308875.1 ABC-type branched-subunit amino acid transport system substrate-binding protein [Xanthobacter tagetidis]RLP80607.1 ABC transporter substrate-binding protein [Xanthobacter tagetidis]
MNLRAYAGCFTAAAVGVFLGASAALAQGTVTIGAVGPFSGPSATSGLAMKKSWDYVTGKVNAAGGIEIDGKKKQIKIIFEDDQSKPEVGVSAAQKLLTRDGVDILLAGLFNSSVTLAIMELVPDYDDKIFYSGQSVSSAIAGRIRAEPAKFKHFWKFGYNSDALGSTVVGTITDLARDGKIPAKAKTIAFVVEDTDYSRSNIEVMKPDFAADGWKIVATEAVPLGYADFYPQISKLKQLNPDVIISIFTAANSGAALVRQLAEQKMATTHMAVYYPGLKEFREAVGPLANGLLYTPLLVDAEGSAAHRAFAAEMVANGMAASLDYGLGICNAQVLMDALARAKSVNADKLSAALEKTDYNCAIGRWVFDPKSHSPRVGKDYFVLPAAQIQDGVPRIVWPADRAAVPFKPRG